MCLSKDHFLCHRSIYPLKIWAQAQESEPQRYVSASVNVPGSPQVVSITGVWKRISSGSKEPCLSYSLCLCQHLGLKFLVPGHVKKKRKRKGEREEGKEKEGGEDGKRERKTEGPERKQKIKPVE